jgi:hypothetical protein
MYYPNLNVYDYFTDGGIEFRFSLGDEVDRVMYYPNLNVYDYFTDGGIEFRFSPHREKRNSIPPSVK